jgi:phosphoglycerate dehydrogenase-like enzyme
MAKQRVAWLVPAKGIFNFELDMPAFDGIDVQIDRTPVSSPGEAMEAVKGADVVMAMAGVVDARLIAAMDKAKAICSFGHGFDRIDVEAATKAGILVTNTAYIGNWEVANHAAAMVLALNRKLVQYDRAMRGGVWDRAAGRPIGPLDGEVAGLVGLGAIGRSLARRLQPFGLTVKAYDPFAEEWAFREYQVERVAGLEGLLGQSDYVSVQVPLNKDTRHMMGEAQFRAMKKTAFFVNCCRGGVHDEKALYRALKEGWIAGAGLDVFEQEPTDPKNPLFSLPNFIASPHAAGESTLSLGWAMKAASHQAAAALRGEWPNRVVNPDARKHLRKA